MHRFRILSPMPLAGIALLALSLNCQQIERTSAKNDGAPPSQQVQSPAAQPAVKAVAAPASIPNDAGVLPSLFDGLAHQFQPVTASIVVHGQGTELEMNQLSPFQAGAEEMILSAGTYGDISRFLTTFPGVVANNDLTNEIIVRGGNPMENLFLVDGIEVPNINHVALLGTTGGFAPMIDSGLVQGVQLYTGGYGAEYPDRLSSVTEIQTLDEPTGSRHSELDFGIQGFGGLHEGRVGTGDLLVSAHQSTMNLEPVDQGSTVLPSYTNELARYRRGESPENQLLLLSLWGRDSVSDTPCAADAVETNTIQSQYSGWRETIGLHWTHAEDKQYFALTASDSEEVSHIRQEDQILNPTNPSQTTYEGRGACPLPAAMNPSTPVYMEDSNNSFANVDLRWAWSTSNTTTIAGFNVLLPHPTYNIQQPVGYYSPYSVTPTRTDSASFSWRPTFGNINSYVQSTAHVTKNLTLSGGVRFQTFTTLTNGSAMLTPRASVHYALTKSVGVYGAYAQYAQLADLVYLAVPQSNLNYPMRVSHDIVGATFDFMPASHIQLEAYKKNYTDTPASTEYPAVSLHDLADMLGDEIVWLPMNSDGWGKALGIELSDFTHIRSSFVARGSIAYSRAKFAGTDNVLRPSNFDFPWIVNVATLQRLSHSIDLSTRFGFATGRPYTPYDMNDSLAQNRPIYDMSKVNAVRAPDFVRLDAQISKDAVIHNMHWEFYGGVENILNRQNFLSYVWMPRLYGYSTNPTQELHQIPIFPNFGVRLIVR